MPDDADLDSLLQRYATGRYRPATFLERGVALPLTTPVLLGARIRPAERAGAELILPNPAGSEGVYILPWPALHDFCAPSLHDRALWERVTALPVLTPATVREAARQVAAEGYAGRAAARAAAQAVAARRDGQAVTEYELVLRLIRQQEPPGNRLAPPERDRPENVRVRIRAILRRHEDVMPAAQALRTLEDAATILSASGIGRAAPEAPLRRLADNLRGLTTEMAEWVATQPEERQGCVDLVVAATELTLRCARRAMAEVSGLADDVWDLLRRWHREAESVRSLAARPDWLLDGWDLIHGLWRSAQTPRQRDAALDEIALLIPLIPNEARDWLGFDAGDELHRHRMGLLHWRRSVLARQDWLTGRIADLADRGEELRALCA